MRTLMEALDLEIDRLKRARQLLIGESVPVVVQPVMVQKVTSRGFTIKPKAKRVLSESAREAIRQGQKKRRAKATKTKPGFITVDGEEYELAEA